MTKRSKAKGTALPADGTFSAAAFPRLGEVLDGIRRGDLSPMSFSFKAARPPSEVERAQINLYGQGARLATGPHAGAPVNFVTSPALPDDTVVIMPSAEQVAAALDRASLRPHRPIGLHGIVVDLLDRLAEPASINLLRSTPRHLHVPTSAVMNVVARAIWRALGEESQVWLSGTTVLVERAGTRVEVDVPEQLLDVLEAAA